MTIWGLYGANTHWMEKLQTASIYIDLCSHLVSLCLGILWFKGGGGSMLMYLATDHTAIIKSVKFIEMGSLY
jgi:hypothetical protein